MTREEALQILDTIPTIGEQVDALEMAIQALSQEPCDDAVSRQAVINAIENDCMKGGLGSCFACYNDAQAFRGEIEKLPSVTQKSGKWISVSERLPEDNYAVLVWCPERKNNYCAYYCAYRAENQWWIFGTYSQKVPLEVTAWMPLPKPYEPQESEDKE